MNSFLDKLGNMLVPTKTVVEPVSFDDPLALRISWDPVNPRGVNFRTHKAVQVQANRIEFRLTAYYKIIPMLLILFALALPTAMVTGTWMKTGVLGLDSNLIVALVISCLALLASVFAYLKVEKVIVFDASYGYFWKGKRDKEIGPFNPAELPGSVKLSDIHAIQIIQELVRGGQKNRKVFESYELNLVLHNGERVNVVDHGDRAGVREDAKILSHFLNVPVWDRLPVIN